MVIHSGTSDRRVQYSRVGLEVKIYDTQAGVYVPLRALSLVLPLTLPYHTLPHPLPFLTIYPIALPSPTIPPISNSPLPYPTPSLPSTYSLPILYPLTLHYPTHNTLPYPLPPTLPTIQYSVPPNPYPPPA